MIPTELISRAAARRFLLAGIASLGVSLSCWAAQPYMDDSNKSVPPADGAPSTQEHLYPRIYAHENFGGLSAQALSKYQFIDIHGTGFDTIGTIPGFAPDTMVLRQISGRAYQGWAQKDLCHVTMGVAFAGTGPASQGGPQAAGCNIYAGHWLYKAGSPLTAAISASALTLQVQSAARFEVGQYVAIYDAPAGSFRNAEHALVTARNTSANTITLKARGYKSNAFSHGAGSIVAQHVKGQTDDSLTWAFNFSTKSPTDANGKTWGEFYADWLAKNYKRYKNGVLTTGNVVGILFDADLYFELIPSATDSNNDLVTDNGMSSTGANWEGDGLDQFYLQLANKIPNAYIMTGVYDARGFDSAQGNENESWLDYGNGDFKGNPKYENLNSMFLTYLFNSGARQRGPVLVHNLTKTATRLYPGIASPLPADNRPFRLELALTLMDSGYFGTHSKYTPDPWWDEFAVDATPSSPTFGQAMAKSNLAGIQAHRGWLGRPLGKFTRVYTDTAFAASQSLIPNGTFDTNLTGWNGNNVGISRTVSGVMDGAGSLWVSSMNSYNPNAYGADVRSGTFNLAGGTGYTVTFSARAEKYRTINVAVGSEPAVRIPVGPAWRRYVIGFQQATAQSTSLRFLLGKENSDVWLDSVYVFRGNANVFRRDFEHGVVLANATPETRTIAVGSGLRRIKGTQDSAVNNGQAVTSVTLAPYDGILLVRTGGAGVTTDPGTDPSTDPGTDPGTGTGAGTASIGDLVWLDSNMNGTQDSGESGLDGVVVELQGCDGSHVASQTTAAGGHYAFANLAAGSYRVKVVPPAGMTLSPAFSGTTRSMDSNVSPETLVTGCLKMADGQSRSWVDAGIIF